MLFYFNFNKIKNIINFLIHLPQTLPRMSLYGIYFSIYLEVSHGETGKTYFNAAWAVGVEPAQLIHGMGRYSAQLAGDTRGD